jgi:ectoine hydroxylase-related dioxygenase (phytanoyl-CoA dioxygenase family)
MLTKPSPAAATDLQPTVKLTPEQIAFYHREGYLALDSITTPEEVAWLRGVYDALFARKAGRDEGNQFDLGGSDEDNKAAVLPQILGPAKYAPELNGGLFRVNALSIAKQLIGDEASTQGDHAILKPAKFGAETPWHQDEAYWNPAMEYNAMSIWMPLQPATMENGCMQFVPMSHKIEIQPHRSINNDPRVHGLEMLTPPDASKAVACPLPAGGCTIHHNRTMHYTGANRSEMPRRAYIMLFGTAPKKRETPLDFPWEKIKQTAASERRAAAEAKAKAEKVAAK